MMIFKKSRIRSETSALSSNYVTGPMGIDVPHNSVLSWGSRLKKEGASGKEGTELLFSYSFRELL